MSNKSNGSGKLLIGLKAIIDYLSSGSEFNRVGQKTFEVLIEMGMPANLIGGRWYADKSNIDEFTRGITKVQLRHVIEETEAME